MCNLVIGLKCAKEPRRKSSIPPPLLYHVVAIVTVKVLKIRIREASEKDIHELSIALFGAALVMK